MLTLKDAVKTGQIGKFVREHRGDPKGDTDTFNKTVEKMAGKSKATPKASSQDGSGD